MKQMLKSIEVKNEQESGLSKLKRQQKKRKNIEVLDNFFFEGFNLHQ